MNVSIVVPTYNRKHDLEVCLVSVFRQNIPKEAYEVIVVDNGPSNDGTREYMEWVCATHTNVSYEKTTEKGCIVARNIGFRKAKGKIYLTLDDDVELLKPGILENLITTFENQDIGMVGGLELKDPNHVPDVGHPNIRKIGRITRWGNFYTGFEKLDGHDQLVDVDHFRSCFMAIRRNLLQEVGGFQQIYDADGMGFRYESDLCLTIQRMGHRVVINPTLRIWHKGAPRKRGFDRDKKSQRYLLLASRNHTFFMIRFFWRKHPVILFLYDFLIGAPRTPGLFYLIKGRQLTRGNLRSVFCGKLWGFRMHRDFHSAYSCLSENKLLRSR